MTGLLLFGLVCAAVTAVAMSRRGGGQRSGSKERGHPVLGWLAGHTHRTNATFTRRSTKDKTDDARKWHRHAGFVRAAARTGTITVLLAVTCGLAFARTATILALAVLVLIPVGAAGWWLYRKARCWWPAKSG